MTAIDDAVSVFIMPPSLDALRTRLLNRGDPPKEVEQRLEKAHDEMPIFKNVWDASEKAVLSLFEDDIFYHELGKVENALESESFFDRVITKLQKPVIKCVPFQKQR